ncbi:hypothetical protein AGMMS50256_34940 [Betaproteobacteria bacterium]|nr:hypothetical protein AGMMS50256_34940 [Betaproteobacteria bacterium]
MTIEQTVEVPASHRLIIDVPREVPTGRVILAFTPVTESHQVGASPSIDALKKEAAQKATARRAYIEAKGKNPLMELRNSMKSVPFAGIDGVEYQRKMRDEWPD